jgi:hypothetical protein
VGRILITSTELIVQVVSNNTADLFIVGVSPEFKEAIMCYTKKRLAKEADQPMVFPRSSA